MTLSQPDMNYLVERNLDHTICVEANMVCLTLQNFSLPDGYDQSHADLLLRLSPGFPDVPPDMWWFSPSIRLKSGGTIAATEHHETHLGKVWQRWSRHLNQGQWQSGIDSLESFIALIRNELSRSVPETVQ